MGTAVDDELFRVFREVAPVVLGRKKIRKLFKAMAIRLINDTPANGCGPVIGVRREACEILVHRMQAMEEDRGAV